MRIPVRKKTIPPRYIALAAVVIIAVLAVWALQLASMFGAGRLASLKESFSEQKAQVEEGFQEGEHLRTELDVPVPTKDQFIEQLKSSMSEED